MKLSTILVLTLCQFLVEATIFRADPNDLSMQENCAEQVRNVQVFEMVNQLVVTWLPPNCNTEGVQVTYILEYSSAGETLTIETRETFHNFDYTTNACFDVELKITPSLDGISGVSYDTIYRESSSQVTHVQVFQMMTQLVVVWNPPECVIGDVQVRYIVTYTTTTETQTIETEQTFHYFDHNGNICSDVEIMIRAVIDGKTGVPYYAIYNTGLGEVANLYAEHINNTVHVEWEAPVGGSDCDLDYLITLDTNKDSISITVGNKFEVDIENIYMQPCENGTVTITPMRGATVGSRLTRIVQGEIGPVRNIVIENDDNEIFVDYDEPENTDLCNLRYSVHYRPADCFQREISIIAFNTFGNSRHVTSTTVDLDMQIPPVNNLVGSRDNNNVIDVTWDQVFPEYNCNVAYRISREFPDGRLNNITRTATSWSDMECRQMTYRVAPVVNDIPGLISKSVTVPASSVLTLCQFLVEATIFRADPNDLSMQENCAEQVRNVQVFEMVNQLVVTWLPPNCNTEGVQVTYILEYSSAGETLTIETRETFHNFDYTTNACFDVELKITPSLDGISGVSYDTIYRENFIHCNVAYRISREFPDGRLNNITRTATSWSDMECRQMTYRVAPVVNDIPGLISKSVTVPASSDPDCMFEPTDAPWEEPWD